MAQLATLEGEYSGISLNDLFDVNDFLGVKYFGLDDWNKIKKYACEITENAAKNPVCFYIESLKTDYPNYSASPFSQKVFGFNDRAGVALMGSIPWERLKVKLDNELLGSVWDWAKDKAGSALSYVKEATNYPGYVYEVIAEKAPVWTTPGLIYEYGYKPMKAVKEGTGEAIEKTQDLYSKMQQKLWLQTPLKYTPTAQYVVKPIEEAKEEIGLTTPGTAGVYESHAEKEAREEAERELAQRSAKAAAQAASAASAAQAAQLKQAKTRQAYEQQISEKQQVLEATQRHLEEQQAISESKYLPLVLGGSVLLLALSIIKGKK